MHALPNHVRHGGRTGVERTRRDIFRDARLGDNDCPLTDRDVIDNSRLACDYGAPSHLTAPGEPHLRQYESILSNGRVVAYVH